MVRAVGRIFGRWLLASVALGTISGAVYGASLAATLGNSDGSSLVDGAPVAMVLGIGMGIGSMIGIVLGIVLGVTLGLAMAVVNRSLVGATEGQYLRRVRVVAALAPVVLGAVLLVGVGRLATLDLVPVAGASLVWTLAAKKVAGGYRALWPASAQR